MCSLDGEVVVGRRNKGTQSIKEVKGRGCVRTEAVAIVSSTAEKPRDQVKERPLMPFSV